MDNNRLLKAVKTLHEHCVTTRSCRECPFNSENKYVGCAIMDKCPCDWNIEEMGKELEGGENKNDKR